VKAAARLTTLAVLCSSLAIAASAVSNPKATGNTHWIDPYSQQPANLTFNAIATSKAGPMAKGSATYTDRNVTYTMDVQFLKVSGNRAWFAGQVTSVMGADGYLVCCRVGDWIFYKVQGEPGANADQIWTEDLTQARQLQRIPAPSRDNVRDLVKNGASTPGI
jgi:hypothetical protein